MHDSSQYPDLMHHRTILIIHTQNDVQYKLYMYKNNSHRKTNKNKEALAIVIDTANATNNTG